MLHNLAGSFNSFVPYVASCKRCPAKRRLNFALDQATYAVRNNQIMRGAFLASGLRSQDRIKEKVLYRLFVNKGL